jgi:hypothetical protein
MVQSPLFRSRCLHRQGILSRMVNYRNHMILKEQNVLIITVSYLFNTDYVLTLLSHLGFDL